MMNSDSQDAIMRELLRAEADLLPVLARQELARERITLERLRAELSELQLANDTVVPVEKYQAALEQLKRAEEALIASEGRLAHTELLLLNAVNAALENVELIVEHCVRNGESEGEMIAGGYWADHQLCRHPEILEIGNALYGN